MLPRIFASSYFNEETVVLSIVKTNGLKRSINNLQVKSAGSQSAHIKQVLWASLNYLQI